MEGERRVSSTSVKAQWGGYVNEIAMPSQEEIDRLYKRLDPEAEAGSFHLNPDVPFTQDLVKGLLINLFEAGNGFSGNFSLVLSRDSPYWEKAEI